MPRLFLAVLALSTIGFALVPASASEPGYCAPPGSSSGWPVRWSYGIWCGGSVNCDARANACNEPRKPLQEIQGWVCAQQDVPGLCDTALPNVQIDGGITGTVTDAHNKALEGICVSAWSNPPAEGTLPEGRALTRSDGSYRIDDLYQDVRIEFVDCRQGSQLSTEWYDNAGDFNSATVISVAVGSDIGGIDAKLSRG